MSNPFFFRPPKPVASTRQSVVKTYVCMRCGEERPASEMVYQGMFMEVIRDKSKFMCKSHLRAKEGKKNYFADANNPVFDGPSPIKPISRAPLPNINAECDE